MLFFLSPLIKPNKLNIFLGPREPCANPSLISAKRGEETPEATLSSKTLYLYATCWHSQMCVEGNVKTQRQQFFICKKDSPYSI